MHSNSKILKILRIRTIFSNKPIGSNSVRIDPFLNLYNLPKFSIPYKHQPFSFFLSQIFKKNLHNSAKSSQEIKKLEAPIPESSVQSNNDIPSTASVGNSYLNIFKSSPPKSDNLKKISKFDQSEVDEWVPELIQEQNSGPQLNDKVLNNEKSLLHFQKDPLANNTNQNLEQAKKINDNIYKNSNGQWLNQKNSADPSDSGSNLRKLGSVNDALKVYNSAKIALGGTVHPLNTYEVVQTLEKAKFSSPKAESIMNCIRELFVKQLALVMSKSCLIDEVEKNSYQINASIQQLRTEMLLIRKNSQSIIQSEASYIARELEILSQQIKEETIMLRSNISIEMNNRRYERFDSIKDLEVRRQEMETIYYYLLGEIKTEIEATKLKIIRKGFLTILVTGLIIIIFIPKKNKNSSQPILTELNHNQPPIQNN
ncbi:hypothetical protein AYI68_g53 [Smittium mucronatum]|uniref:Uncharacterized protein n=1 Tax=Smittium mucronatum TaxID=133383 RepID=A0A1R0H9A9_9FUNG|nr:hypothetical protein AYI68_g53 [Smittium mucronatum]